METISFGKRTRVVFLIILIVVILIILVEWKNSKRSSSGESTFNRLSKRWRKLSHEIEEEMRTLKLTLEMKIFVEKKISYWLKWAKTSFVVIFAIVAGLFYWKSHEILFSLMNAVWLFIFICGSFSFLLADRFAESNSIIRYVSSWIRKWVYQKYGYDPYETQLLQQSIQEKKIEANLIMIEIRHVNTLGISNTTT